MNRLKHESFVESSVGATVQRWETYELKKLKKKSFFKVTRKNRVENGDGTTTTVQEYHVYYKNVFIHSLNSDLYTLSKPISVTLEYYGNVCIAINYDLDIYGYGDSEVEAIDELKSLVVEFYEDLKEEKALAPIPKKMMNFYNEIIRKKIIDGNFEKGNRNNI